MKRYLLHSLVLVFIANTALQAKSIKDALKEEGYSYTCPKVTYVDLSNKGIDDWAGLKILPKKFPDMKHLSLRDNCLEYIPPFIVECLYGLSILDLSDNSIKSVSTVLYNSIGSESISTTIYLRNNPLSTSEKELLRYYGVKVD